MAEGSHVDLTLSVYNDLRKLAAARMAAERAPQTLQATALVHEAWLRLGGDIEKDWADQKQFVSAAARVMRCILVDRARYRKAICHGGDQKRILLEEWNWELADPSTVGPQDEALLALNDALEKFEVFDPETAKLVQLHYFAGLNVQEASEVMKLSLRTTERRLAYARAWLGREMEMTLGTG